MSSSWLWMERETMGRWADLAIPALSETVESIEHFMAFAALCNGAPTRPVIRKFVQKKPDSSAALPLEILPSLE